MEVSASFKDLVTKMLNPDPKKRLTLDEVKAHVWFNGACNVESSKGELMQCKLVIEQEMKREKARRKRVKALTQLYMQKKQGNAMLVKGGVKSGDKMFFEKAVGVSNGMKGASYVENASP